ncbi:MAG: hypothetical protein JW874_03190 [Spirochaetales bacterium]|nr:hypothetical protein [Spirochaetales bacterium]
MLFLLFLLLYKLLKIPDLFPDRLPAGVEVDEFGNKFPVFLVPDTGNAVRLQARGQAQPEVDYDLAFFVNDRVFSFAFD